MGREYRLHCERASYSHTLRYTFCCRMRNSQDISKFSSCSLNSTAVYASLLGRGALCRCFSVFAKAVHRSYISRQYIIKSVNVQQLSSWGPLERYHKSFEISLTSLLWNFQVMGFNSEFMAFFITLHRFFITKARLELIVSLSPLIPLRLISNMYIV